MITRTYTIYYDFYFITQNVFKKLDTNPWSQIMTVRQNISRLYKNYSLIKTNLTFFQQWFIKLQSAYFIIFYLSDSHFCFLIETYRELSNPQPI